MVFRVLVVFRVLMTAVSERSRYAAGKPLSVLDGVPFAVKDLMDALPCPTGAGTAYLASTCAKLCPSTPDADVLWVYLIKGSCRHTLYPPIDLGELPGLQHRTFQARASLQNQHTQPKPIA